MGRVRGRPAAHHRAGPEHRHLRGDGEEVQDQGADELPGEAPEAAPHLRDPVLSLRVPLPRQHHHAAVPHESLLRRRVLLVRAARDELLRDAAGAARRPDGVCVPARHQVRLPQVRSVRQHPEARLAVHPAAEHCQREDVHLHLVLVHHPLHHAGRTADLQVRGIVKGHFD